MGMKKRKQVRRCARHDNRREAESNTGRMRGPYPPCIYERDARQSPNVNNDAFPPAAVVFTVTVFSVANRGR
jgi:hypothetical protein